MPAGGNAEDPGVRQRSGWVRRLESRAVYSHARGFRGSYRRGCTAGCRPPSRRRRVTESRSRCWAARARYARIDVTELKGPGMRAEGVMTRNTVTIGAGAPGREAARLRVQHRA